MDKKSSEIKARKPISKRVRFEVFKRDHFVCQYCGATPPNVVLHVDHVIPVAKGGTNHIDNLVTSCDSCNLGKGAISLTVIPKTIAEKAAIEKEREEQIKEYNVILSKKSRRITDEAWDIASQLEEVDYLEKYDRSRFESIKRFVEKLPVAMVAKAADIAVAKRKNNDANRFKYFCGVCWAMIKEGSGV